MVFELSTSQQKGTYTYLHPCLPLQWQMPLLNSCPLHTQQTPPNSPQLLSRRSILAECRQERLAGRSTVRSPQRHLDLLPELPQPLVTTTAREAAGNGIHLVVSSGFVQMTLHRTRRTRSRKSAKHRRDGSFTTLIRTSRARLCPA